MNPQTNGTETGGDEWDPTLSFGNVVQTFSASTKSVLTVPTYQNTLMLIHKPFILITSALALAADRSSEGGTNWNTLMLC